MDGDEARDARLAPDDQLRGRPRLDRRLVPGERGVVASRPLGRLGRLVRPPVRAAAGDRPGGAGHARDRRLMRVAVTGAAGRLGRHLVAALADAPFTGPAGPIAWDRAEFDLDAPDDIGVAPRPRATRGRGPRRRLDRRRRLRPRPGARAASATGPPRASSRRPARSGGSTSSRSRPTRSSTARGWTAMATCRPTRSSPANPYGASKAEGERLAAAAFAARPGAALGIARTAWLFGAPGRDFPSKILDAAERARAAGEPLRLVERRVGHADVHGRCRRGRSSGCWPRTRRPASTTSSTASSRPGPTGRATSSAGRASRSTSSTSRPPPGSARRGRRAGASWPRRHSSGEPMRSWPDAMADYAPALLRTMRARA